MGGVLTHLVVALVGAGLVYYHYREYLYSFGFFIGHLLPDAIKFGIAGIRYRTFSFYEIVSKELFWTLDSFSHSLIIYFGIFVVIIGIMFTLWKTHKIEYVYFIKTFYFLFYLVVAVYLHLIIDIFYLEPSYWL